MNPIDTLNAAAARTIADQPRAGEPASPGDFLDAMRARLAAIETPPPPSDPTDSPKADGNAPPDPRFAAARAAAGDLISVSLVKPILAQLRATTMAEGPFKPGLWEKQFAPLMDAAWADNLVKSSHWDILDAVARQLMNTNDKPAADAAHGPQAHQRSAQP